MSKCDFEAREEMTVFPFDSRSKFPLSLHRRQGEFRPLYH